MFANPLNILGVLQGTKVYRVPIYQRRYSWVAKEWQSLWNDIEYKLKEVQGTSKPRPHFLGNIVVQSMENTNTTVVNYLVIDGQQRLTTVITLLAAIRDRRAASNPQWDPAAYDNKYLINPFDTEDTDRLVPTELDRDDYVSTIRTGEPRGAIGRAYLFFSRVLRGRSDTELELIANIVLVHLLIIFVETDEKDPVNTIFNTLNSKGRPLLPPDLIRNEIFMYLGEQDSRESYRHFWLPLEKELVGSPATFLTFFWSREVPYHPTLSKKLLYNAFESRIRSAMEGLEADERVAEIRLEMVSIKEDFDLFKLIRSPATLGVGANSVSAEVLRALQDLAAWGSDTHIPVSLWILKQNRSNRIDDADAARALRVLLSFLVYRALNGVPTNTLSRIFSRLPAVIKSSDESLSEAIVDELTQGGNRWPSIEETSMSLSSFGWGSLPERQVKFVKERAGDLAEASREDQAVLLRDWLVSRSATKPEVDRSTQLDEDLDSLRIMLESLRPHEFTTVEDLLELLRLSESQISSLLRNLELPLLQMIRTNEDLPIAVDGVSLLEVPTEDELDTRVRINAYGLRDRMAEGSESDAEDVGI